MTYKHGDYWLYTMQVSWKGDADGSKKRPIWFFAKKPPEEQKKGTPCDIPEGKVVVVNERTGLPFLKKA